MWNCGFCGRVTQRATCVCGRARDEVVGLGPTAGAAAARICQTLAASGTVFRDVQAVVAEATRVLDGEGVGRLAAPVLGLDGDVEAALAEAWGYHREEVTLWGEPLGSFELPASVFGKTTRRVDRRDDAIAFTVVEDPVSGRGFVGVWDPGGRLLWAPPQARDLRFAGKSVELLFDTWRERRAWPSRKLLERSPCRDGDAKNLRFTLVPRSRRAAILTSDGDEVRLWVPGPPYDVNESIVRGAPPPVDVVIAPGGRFVAVVTGVESAPDPGLAEYRAATLSYYSLDNHNGTQTAIFAPLPKALPELLALQVLPPPEITGKDRVRLRLAGGMTVEHKLEAKHLAARENVLHWREVERPRVELPRRQIFGDFGRRLAEVAMPPGVDFEPIPVASAGRSPDGAIAFTLRPRFGKELSGIGVHLFPDSGAGVTAIWKEATGELLHVLDEPGEVQWLDAEVMLVFHVDSLEALRWPTRERLWRIPLASPLRGETGPGVPVGLAATSEVAVAVWSRPKSRGAGPQFGYTVVDLGARPAQRLGTAYVSPPSQGDLPRGPTFLPDGRRFVLSTCLTGWFRWGGAFAGPGLDFRPGRILVHDLAANAVAEETVPMHTPDDFAEPAWHGSDVLGAPRLGPAGEVLVDLPTGATWTTDLSGLGEFRPLVQPVSTPRPRVTVTCGEGERRAAFPVPLEVPFALAGSTPWARRASWSAGLDRVVLTLAPGNDRAATLLCGIWDPRTGDLIEVLPGHAADLGAWETTLAVLAEGEVQAFAWPDRRRLWTWPAGDANDVCIGRWQMTVNTALLEEGGTSLRVVNVIGKREVAHQTRRRSTFRGPGWASEGRHAVFAAFDADTGRAGELIVIDTHLRQVRETALPEDLAATTLDVTPEGTVRLGAARWQLADLLPLDHASVYLPTPPVVPRMSGRDALDDLDRIPNERLRAKGATVLPEVLYELVDDPAMLLTVLEAHFDRARLDEPAVLMLPFLVALVADEALALRDEIVDFLARVHARAESEDDTRALAAFRASRDWLIAGAATHPVLGELLAR